ncbi:hypothetical protein, partial [Enterococcus faecium]|uniref:hypothetical protein n=1 Tax=Enterococcus faecium TaxID=1352 RepID=UPI003F4288B6
LSPGPYALFAIQCLDGASAAVFGIALPLAAAAITRGTPHFNLCLGALGLITGAAAAASTSIGGLLADRSAPLAFVTLGVFGILGAVCAATWPGA